MNTESRDNGRKLINTHSVHTRPSIHHDMLKYEIMRLTMPPGGHQLWPFCTLINANNDTFFNRYAQNYDQSGWTDYSGVFYNHTQWIIMCFRSIFAVENSELFKYFLRNVPFSHLNTFKQAARPTYQLFTVKNNFFTLQTCAFNKFQRNIWPHGTQNYAFSDLCSVCRWIDELWMGYQKPYHKLWVT